MFIDGKWVGAECGRNFQSFNPATGDPIGHVPDGESADAIKAIDAAAGAFPDWSAQTAHSRSRFLYKAHALMMEDLERLATIMTEEQGKPIQAAQRSPQPAAENHPQLPLEPLPFLPGIQTQKVFFADGCRN